MKRLIYAHKLRKDILDLPNCPNGFSDTYDKATIVDMIDEQPSVDAVPVIRCKDCKYSSPNQVYGCRIHSFADDIDKRLYADDFCSQAEKKEE